MEPDIVFSTLEDKLNLFQYSSLLKSINVFACYVRIIPIIPCFITDRFVSCLTSLICTNELERYSVCNVF